MAEGEKTQDGIAGMDGVEFTDDLDDSAEDFLDEGLTADDLADGAVDDFVDEDDDDVDPDDLEAAGLEDDDLLDYDEPADEDDEDYDDEDYDEDDDDYDPRGGVVRAASHADDERIARLEAAARSLAGASVARDQRKVRRKVKASATGAGAVGFIPILLQLVDTYHLSPELASALSAGAALIGSFVAGWITPEREPALPPPVAHDILAIGTGDARRTHDASAGRASGGRHVDPRAPKPRRAKRRKAAAGRHARPAARRRAR